jgi:hypothetical protein
MSKYKLHDLYIGCAYFKQMLRKAILFLCTLTVAVAAFSQQKDAIELPAEINTTVKGIEVKITLLRITLQEEVTYGDMVLAFKNPLTSEWIYFDAEGARISRDRGLVYSFMLNLRNGFKESDTDFTKSILEQKSGKSFIWNCHCDDILLPLF